MVGLVPVITGSSPITVVVGVEEPTMEAITWATTTKTGLAAMLEPKIGGTEVLCCHHKSLLFFVWLMLHELTIFVLSLMK